MFRWSILYFIPLSFFGLKLPHLFPTLLPVPLTYTVPPLSSYPTVICCPIVIYLLHAFLCIPMIGRQPSTFLIFFTGSCQSVRLDRANQIQYLPMAFLHLLSNLADEFRTGASSKSHSHANSPNLFSPQPILSPLLGWARTLGRCTSPSCSAISTLVWSDMYEG